MKIGGIAKNIDEYISRYPVDIQKKLEEVRAAIRKAAPMAEEMIIFQMPAFNYNGVLVYFNAQPDYIGLYPTSTAVENFKKELAGYKTTKGAIEFPYDKPLPSDLIARIVTFRLRENLKKTELEAENK